ncbi:MULTISPECIES: hypothetical protein [unclassified Leclercia]|uniref:Bacteriocin n=1 Tax=Leclercia barmai TaxID=2785629 RepID=A0ABS7RYE8_9ENTR|nr:MULTISPECIES: hypothetical protein [unclassified Leclercia]MBZ0059324.1 hypothetical protein [Leclercia sp. EMC7]MCM5697510.1 hypothetical protein [Leclercia sp. LTM01]MCM5701864.1 hypothetical protein [Leclercia sp. LTM14]
MRELNNQEMDAVSGAGLFADAAALLGKGIGGIVDAACKTGTEASTAGEAMGRGIGLIVENSVTILQSLFSGLSGLFSKN